MPLDRAGTPAADLDCGLDAIPAIFGLTRNLNIVFTGTAFSLPAGLGQDTIGKKAFAKLCAEEQQIKRLPPE